MKRRNFFGGLLTVGHENIEENDEISFVFCVKLKEKVIFKKKINMMYYRKYITYV